MTRMPGVVIAIVRSLDDPQGEGRIQVEYPWMPDSPVSNWAPVASPLAGQDRGMFFMPEPGDEVLVAFEQGDFEHPFVLGSLWNGVDLPPDTDRRHRRVRTPGGNEILLDDTTGAELIRIQTKGGLVITMSDGATPSIELNGGGRSLKLVSGEVQIT